MLSKKSRCINIDWLEVHALEPIDSIRDAEFFKAAGWDVDVRPYGTRVYQEMFTLIWPNGERFLEIRRNPAASKSSTAAQFFEINSVHLRLTNRSCYLPNCAQLLHDFMVQYNFQFKRISRIDICMDFEKFDKGDNPKDFIDRYLRGKYSKINQGNVRAYGKDLWDGRFWNSVAWGAPKSQIGTKLYNKTLELKEAHDKPYIRQAWAAAGLVDDFIQLTKKGADGTYYKPDIWRVEFSIQSSVKGWYCIEHDNLGNPKKHSFRNDLSRYATKADMLNVFASLADHYFHFKHFEVGQRKDRCKDKVLFDFTNEEPVFYSIEKVATAKPENKDALILLRRLMAYKVTHYDKEVNKAVDLLIDTLQEERLRKCAVQPHDETEVELLRKLISIRMQTNALNDLTIDMETAKAMVTIEKDIWNNNN